MADQIPEPQEKGREGVEATIAALTRKEKRRTAKKAKRKEIRKQVALKGIEEEQARWNDPEEQRRIRLKEQEEAEARERELREFEERERAWLEAAAKRKEEDEERRRLQEESRRNQVETSKLDDDDDEDAYVEDGPAEIVWQGNEIIVKKKRVKGAKNLTNLQPNKEDAERPTSNPLPPQSAEFAAYSQAALVSSQHVFESVAQQVPNFGTEQDKAHCPFHIKTGACRFGTRCSRVHLYPDKSCTLLIKNMYNGPGLPCEQDEGLEHTDEEIERSYEEFYEDVHTEFLKFGELVNFKVCRNGSSHLRGNVYMHYKYLESAVLSFNSTNGRYFGGKQVICEFVGVTRWKVAICGEYMKSRYKTCSRGTACNFLHCFRNPGGDYEWADCDNPPPRYWLKKMAALFGPSDELQYDKHTEVREGNPQRSAERKSKTNGKRSSSSRRKSSEDTGIAWENFSERGLKGSRYSNGGSDLLDEEKAEISPDGHEKSGRKFDFDYSKYNKKHHGYDSDGGEKVENNVSKCRHHFGKKYSARYSDQIFSDEDESLYNSSSRRWHSTLSKDLHSPNETDGQERLCRRRYTEDLSNDEYSNENQDLDCSDHFPSKTRSTRRRKERHIRSLHEEPERGLDESEDWNSSGEDGRYRSKRSTSKEHVSDERHVDKIHEPRKRKQGTYTNRQEKEKCLLRKRDQVDGLTSGEDSGGQIENELDLDEVHYNHGSRRQSHGISCNNKRYSRKEKIYRTHRKIRRQDSEEENRESEKRASRKHSRSGSLDHSSRSRKRERSHERSHD